MGLWHGYFGREVCRRQPIATSVAGGSDTLPASPRLQARQTCVPHALRAPETQAARVQTILLGGNIHYGSHQVFVGCGFNLPCL